MGEIVGRDWKARMIRSVKHGKVKIAAEEERERRERDSRKFRETVDHFFIQVKGASIGGVHTRSNEWNGVGRSGK